MNTIVIALFALVAVCQAAILPLSAGIIGGPTVVNDGLLGLSAPGVITTGSIATPWAAAPIAVATPWSAQTVAVANPLSVQTVDVATPLAAQTVLSAVPTGTEYVAANRGSVHVAPLPGHVVGSQQLNLSPAPGTW